MSRSSRSLAPTAPVKGSFPLDHHGDCETTMKSYMACLRKEKGEIEACRSLAKAYLQCRMDNNLMSKEDLSELGFDRREQDENNMNIPKSRSQSASRKEKGGFVAGRSRFQETPNSK